MKEGTGFYFDRKKASPFSGERGFSLLSVIFVLLAMSAVGVGVSQTVSSKARASAEEALGLSAFNSAEAGLQYAITQRVAPLTDFSGLTDETQTFGDASVAIRYLDKTQYSAMVESTATIGNTKRTVQQKVSQALPLGKSVYAGGDIAFDINPICGGFRNNYCLPMSGYTTADFGAGGSISLETLFWAMGTETPYMSVVLPGSQVDALVPLITDTTHNGNLTVGPGYFGQNVHVTGDVAIQGGAAIDGNIVADGDITIQGTVTALGTIAAGGSIDASLANSTVFIAEAGPNGEVLPALMAEENIDIYVNGLGSLIRGPIISGGETYLHSDIEVRPLLALILGMIAYVCGADFSEIQFDLMAIDGAVLTGEDFRIENNEGFVLIYDRDDQVATMAQKGNLKMRDWKES